MGYALLEQQIMQQAEPGAPPPGRHVLWRSGHEILLQSQTNKELKENGEEDILAKALNKPEYLGCVRGMGFGISQKNYQYIRKNRKQDQLLAIVATLQARVNRMDAELVDVKGKLAEKKAAEKKNNTPSVTDSCMVAGHNLPEGISRCILYLSTPNRHVVAKGKVHNGEQILHNTPLPPNHAKVIIEIVVEPSAPLPVPDVYDDITIVHEAMGAFVAWPLDLIISDARPVKSKGQAKDSQKTNESIASPIKIGKKENPKNNKKRINKGRKDTGKVVCQGPSTPIDAGVAGIWCNFLRQQTLHWSSISKSCEIPMDKDIFGELGKEFISAEEINEILRHGWIGASVMCIFIRYLYYELMLPTQNTSRFFFLSPHQTWDLSIPTSQYIAKMLTRAQHDEVLFLAPCYIGKHWVLIATNPTSNVIYYLDSLPNQPRKLPIMKEIFTNAMAIYHGQRGSRMSKSKTNANWITIKCPQQTNGIDCGYYVMKFMKETITLNQISFPLEYFPEYRCDSYTQQQLTELEEDWARYFIKKFIS
ncbi:Ulp1 protease family, C-terminal catalytic domain [Sesbania bispinosa]|nr:Ulp1 protease family, C-terminal catalytic domain [Sesbania bispinosa]